MTEYDYIFLIRIINKAIDDCETFTELEIKTLIYFREYLIKQRDGGLITITKQKDENE